MKLLPVLLLLGLATPLLAQKAVPVIALKPDPPIAVDGNLEEWASVPGAIVVNAAAHVTFNASSWKDANDLSAVAHLAWRSEGLYLAVDVTDDLVLQTQRDERIYQGDHIEWFLDFAPDAEPARNTFGKGPVPVRLQPPGTPSAPATRWWTSSPRSTPNQPKGSGVSAIKYAAVRTTRGWAMEACVPWTLVGVSNPAVNMLLTTEVALSDTDSSEPAQESYMTLGTERWEYGTPATAPDGAGRCGRQGDASRRRPSRSRTRSSSSRGETAEVPVPAVWGAKGQGRLPVLQGTGALRQARRLQPGAADLAQWYLP